MNLPFVSMKPFVRRHIASLLPPLTVVIRSHLHGGTPLRSRSSSVTSPQPANQFSTTSDDHRLLPSSPVEISRGVQNSGVEPEILKSVPENFAPPPVAVEKIFDQPRRPSIAFGEEDLVSDESLWNLYERWMAHWAGHYLVPKDHNEKVKRFETFKKKAKWVHEFNKQGKSFTVCLNMFSASEPRKYTGYREELDPEETNFEKAGAVVETPDR